VRIAISCHPVQGGSGIVATELATALAHRGHEVHLAACELPYRLREDSGVIFHKVHVPDYPLFRYPPHDLSLANRLADIAKSSRTQIIHAHYAIPHAVAALLARQVVMPQRVRIVTTLHGTDITLVGSHAEFYDLTRHAMQESDGLTAVSAWLRDETQRRFSLPVPPVVIPNFVDPVRFTPEGRAPYPSASQEFHVLHASNLRPVKRIADVVRVFHCIQSELPARMTILGEGPEKGSARELASELGLCGKITFASTADDVPAVMRSAHLKMLLSDYESFGLSAIEAMASGTPVAGSDSGGLREVIEDGRTGLLCKVGGIEETARRAIALLSDREAWERMSLAAVAGVRARFGLETIVPMYEELYEKVIATDS
jgi:N-acetyl-alpha-D-glucosaminyl L-malate synthase BshA